jgi:hypothetical protein
LRVDPLSGGVFSHLLSGKDYTLAYSSCPELGQELS